jgi:iron complex outermembrane recepter protein
MPRMCLRAGLLAGASVAVSGVSAFAQANAPEQVVIEGARSVAMRDMLPTTIESISIDDLRAQVNVTNTEDALKYLPDIVVRKRHAGDTQAPISTRRRSESGCRRCRAGGRRRLSATSPTSNGRSRWRRG